jgi:hypothetical protein
MTAFDSYRVKAYPHRFHAELLIGTIAGGIPTNDRVAEAWLRTKLAASDDLIREAVATTMVERGVTADEAAKIVDEGRHLNGFKRDPEAGLYIEGRQIKAAIKEAASVAGAAGTIPRTKYGLTNKNVLNFVSEHIFVLDDRIPLGTAEPSGVVQRFIHTFRGTGIQYEEYVEDAKISFTVVADWDFGEEFWAHLWLTGEQQGIGASRSQGFGRYTVTTWTPLTSGSDR